MFSVMDWVKTDRRNRMGRDRLDASLTISAEGERILNYSLSVAVDLWFNAKVCRLNCCSHSYSKQQITISMSFY